MHVFIDESKRGSYLLCAVTVASGDVRILRNQLESLRPRGHRRIHMKNAGKHAGRIVDGVARLDAHSTLFVVKDPRLSEREARDCSLKAATRVLMSKPVTRVVIESCDQDREDNRVLRDAVGPNPPFSYQHEGPSNPLLWLPDVHAWAWGRGGTMRQKIEHRIDVTHL